MFLRSEGGEEGAQVVRESSPLFLHTRLISAPVFQGSESRTFASLDNFLRLLAALLLQRPSGLVTEVQEADLVNRILHVEEITIVHVRVGLLLPLNSVHTVIRPVELEGAQVVASCILRYVKTFSLCFSADRDINNDL